MSYEEYMNTFKKELLDNFFIYGAESGLLKNSEILCGYRDTGIITEEEYKQLRKFNRTTYSNLPLDM